MAGIWVVAEAGADGGLTRASTEIATLARELSAASGLPAVGVVVAPAPATLADALAAYLPRVLAVTGTSPDAPWAQPAAVAIAALASAEDPDLILVSASPDGHDVAGTLAALLGRGVIGNANAIGWDRGPVVEKGVFGGRLITSSRFTGPKGIVTVRPGAATAEPAASAGRVEPIAGSGEPLPAVRVVERIGAAGAAVQLEEAKVIVSGGRGVGGPDGFRLVERIAARLGGAVGASRAAVDSGWIPYAQQVGQTGKIVKPALYLALGISGAIQHKVGMQTSETIIAVNRDSDAPIAEFADLLGVGDLFEVGEALLRELDAREG